MKKMQTKLKNDYNTHLGADFTYSIMQKRNVYYKNK